MAAHIAIRHASEEDLTGIHALIRDWGYTASSLETQERLNALLSSPIHEVFVALDAETIVGWVVAEQRISLGTGMFAEITAMVVGSNHRRAGIGIQLVARVEEWSKDLGLQKLVVRSNLTRHESHEFYRALGFAIAKTTRVYSKTLHIGDKPFVQPP